MPILNPNEVYPDDEVAFTRPLETEWADGTMGLAGSFYSSEEYLESRSHNATVYLQFNAFEVDMVVSFGTNTPQSLVTIRYNDQPLYPEIRGKDLDERDELRVQSPCSYNILHSKEPLNGMIEIITKEGTTQFYAFSFSGCPPLQDSRHSATDQSGSA
jgi:hypothetical protein